MKAWKTTALGIDSIVAAETRAKAKAATVRAAREASFSLHWNEIWARRAPEHDAWAESARAGHCVTVEYATEEARRTGKGEG